jgi:hypothetical protein
MEELNSQINQEGSVNHFVRDTPPNLAPYYSMQEPNQSVLLYEGNMEVKYASQEARAVGYGILHLKWLPSIEIEFEITNTQLVGSPINFSDALQNNENLSLTLIDTGICINCFLVQVTTHGVDSCGLIGRLERTVIGDQNAKLKYLLFHLVNFSEFIGDNILCELNISSGYRWKKYAGRLTFEAEGWRITVDAVESYSDIFRELKNRSGYAFTHTVKLEKIGKSDEAFSPDEAEKLLEALIFFFSFARGIYSTPFLPIGFDSNNTKVWELWETMMVSSWTYVHSWFSGKRNSQSLADIFPTFISYWNNSKWNNSLRWSINWYVESNRGGGTPDGKIIWVQSALELLSWTYFVTEGRMSKRKFKDLKTNEMGEAEAGIKKLLEELNIPVSFSSAPVGLQNLADFIQSQGLNNYLHTFVKIRNDIVHPEKRFQPSFDAKIEALHLGLWYLELVLLRLFKYEGYYASRLEGMNLKPTPWT